MRMGSRNERGVWTARGGSGAKLLVLLHGIGANATVWEPFIAHVEAAGGHRWLAPDFRGHGRSAMEGPYGYAAHAADVAHLIRDEDPDAVTVVGHSFGGVVAAVLATGWFGVPLAGVATVGVKLDWSGAEIAKARELAGKPARTLASREEAVERYLKGAGLFGLVDPASASARVGIIEADGTFRVAVDPRVYGAVGPDLEPIFARAQVPLRMAAGSKDPMVTLAAMQSIRPDARVFDGLGHNAHWEAPEAVYRFATQP